MVKTKSKENVNSKNRKENKVAEKEKPKKAKTLPKKSEKPLKHEPKKSKKPNKLQISESSRKFFDSFFNELDNKSRTTRRKKPLDEWSSEEEERNRENKKTLRKKTKLKTKKGESEHIIINDYVLRNNSEENIHDDSLPDLYIEKEKNKIRNYWRFTSTSADSAPLSECKPKINIVSNVIVQKPIPLEQRRILGENKTVSNATKSNTIKNKTEESRESTDENTEKILDFVEQAFGIVELIPTNANPSIVRRKKEIVRSMIKFLEK